jgi:23S rRNA pseudouridine955/2504/2580 synthase/23S rRNA pseudouridine1911/1915/1917 synthase
MTRELRFTVREKDAGMPLASFLAGRFTYHSEPEWRRLVGEGRVVVNGAPSDPERLLEAGDAVCYDASGIAEPPVDTDFRVVTETPWLLVVDKPGNLPCHPGGRYFNHTLWAFLKTRCGVDAPVFVNRIDRETSGLVIVARKPEAAAGLMQQFAAHTVVKRYTVFVEGVFPERLETAGWLTGDPHSAIRKKRRFVPAAPGSPAPSKAAEWAETAFVREYVCIGFSVVTALPRTGRLHQIRATLLALGYPVTGDKLYGVDETLFLRLCEGALTPADYARLRMRRQALHAGALRFRHPGSGAWMEVVAPLPPDMEKCVSRRQEITYSFFLGLIS